MKKLKTISLVMLVFIMLLTSCTSEKKEKNSNGDAPEITMFYNRGVGINIKEDDKIYTEIERKTNVKLKLIVPSQQEYSQKLNIIMASGDLPDVIRSDLSITRNYAKQGALIPLDDLLKKYAPNTTTFIEKDIWNYTKVDGKIYAIPTVKTPQKNNMYLRKDWLDNLGLQIPKTLEEFKAVFKDFKEKDPDQNGKDDTYGYLSQQFTAASIAFAPFFGAYEVMPGSWYIDENGKIAPYSIHPKTKEALAFIKSLHAEGLVNPDWLAITSEQSNQIMDRNSAGAAYGWWNYPTNRLPHLKQIAPSADLIPVAPPIGPYGTNANSSGPVIGTVAYNITSKCENPEAAMRFLDYFYSVDGMLLSPMGLKGEHWTWESGKEDPTTIDELNSRLDDLKVTESYTKDFDRRTAFSLYEPQIDFLLLAGRDKKSIDCINFTNSQPVIKNYGDGITTDSAIKYNTALNKLMEETFVKIIIGEYPLDKFDSFADEWLNSGGTNLIEEMNSKYQEFLIK